MRLVRGVGVVVGILVVFVLSLVVFFHELGHFLVARWCGVRVMVFSIGFGPEIVGFNDRRGTRWKISAIPLGGFVKFLGDATVAALRAETMSETGDALLFVGDRAHEATDVAGRLRLEIGERLGLRDPAAYKFCWVRGFPLFERSAKPATHE